LLEMRADAAPFRCDLPCHTPTLSCSHMADRSSRRDSLRNSQVVADDWVSFPGGELEGERPKVLCPACRAALNSLCPPRRSPARAVCFQCYRASLERERAIKAAGELATASEARFQSTLPFEPVDRVRLGVLKAERAAERTTAAQGAGRFETSRRQAQIAARHTLQRVLAGVKARPLPAFAVERGIASAIHAAELQLPESWLPFVVSR
jgi:hypothetical protein